MNGLLCFCRVDEDWVKVGEAATTQLTSAFGKISGGNVDAIIKLTSATKRDCIAAAARAPFEHAAKRTRSTAEYDKLFNRKEIILADAQPGRVVTPTTISAPMG